MCHKIINGDNAVVIHLHLNNIKTALSGDASSSIERIKMRHGDVDVSEDLEDCEN